VSPSRRPRKKKGPSSGAKRAGNSLVSPLTVAGFDKKGHAGAAGDDNAAKATSKRRISLVPVSAPTTNDVASEQQQQRRRKKVKLSSQQSRPRPLPPIVSRRNDINTRNDDRSSMSVSVSCESNSRPAISRTFSQRLDVTSAVDLDAAQSNRRIAVRPFTILPNEKQPRTSIQCIENDATLWHDIVSGAVISVVGNALFAAVCTARGSLIVYSPSGRRLMPPISLGEPATFLACSPGRASALLALCPQSGRCHVWDVARRRRLVRAEARDLLTDGRSELFDARVTPNGVPCVHVQNREEPHRVSAYAFDVELGSWVMISAYDRFVESDFYRSENVASGPLASIERNVCSIAEQQSGGAGASNSAAATTAAALLGSGNDRSAAMLVTRAHLENQLCASVLLHSASEFRRWMKLYIAHLRDFKMMRLVREICEELIHGTPVPRHESNSEDAWTLESMAVKMPESPTAAAVSVRAAACGTSFSSMIRSIGLEPFSVLENIVLPLLRTDRAWQGLAGEFHDLLLSSKRTVEGVAS